MLPLKNLPTRATHILVLFALAKSYEKPELIEILWPRDKEAWGIGGQPRDTANSRLDNELRHARTALDLPRGSGFLSSEGFVVERTAEGKAIQVVSDWDEFEQLASSSDPKDLRSALNLVRGEVAERIRWASDLDRKSIDAARNAQRRQIDKVLEKLNPEASAEELEALRREVLAGRYHAQTRPRVDATDAADSNRERSHALQAPLIPAADQELENVPSGEPKRRARLHWRKPVAAAVIAIGLCAIAAVVVLSPWSPNSSSAVPPFGYIVNTWTGKASPHLQTHETLPLGSGAQIGGGAIFSACDITASVRCNYIPVTHPFPIDARVGDVIEFRIRLSDPYEGPVPYVKIQLLADGPKYVHGSLDPEDLEVLPYIAWPESEAHSVGVATGIPPIDVHMPGPGVYRFSYIPGSTFITGPAHVSFQLPDGIASSGLQLEDVGSPHNCFECATAYARAVTFGLRVLEGSSP